MKFEQITSVDLSDVKSEIWHLATAIKRIEAENEVYWAESLSRVARMLYGFGVGHAVLSGDCTCETNYVGLR